MYCSCWQLASSLYLTALFLYNTAGGYYSKKFKSVGRGVVTSSAVEIGNRSKAGQELPKDSVLDYETIIVPSADNAGKFSCAHCGTRVTSMWRRLPGETDPERQLPRVYCYDCGNDWIRYVALPPVVDAQKDIKKLKGKDPSGGCLLSRVRVLARHFTTPFLTVTVFIHHDSQDAHEWIQQGFPDSF